MISIPGFPALGCVPVFRYIGAKIWSDMERTLQLEQRGGLEARLQLAH
jgi:hypothetical protein